MDDFSLPGKPEYRRFLSLFIISLTSFIIAFCGSSLSIAAPSIQLEMNLDAATLSWVITLYILATAIFQIPFGKVADRIGRKRIYISGIIFFTSASFGIVFVQTAPLLLLLRFIQGIGGAQLFATSTAILTSIFPSDKKGTAFGINIFSVYIGLTTGPFLGGIITKHLTWRWIFIITTIFGVLSIILLFTGLKGEWVSDKQEAFDYVGTIIYIFSLFAFLYGFRLLPNYFGYIAISCSVVSSIFFLFWESKIESPLIDLRIFKNNRFFNFANLTSLTYYTATSATSFLLSLYLQQVKGMDSQLAGLILLARPISQAIIAPIGGFLSDFIEHRILTTAGTIIGAISLFLLIFINENTSVILIVLSLGLGGLGFGMFSSPNTNSIMSSVSKQFYGVASALIGTMRTIGQTLSMGFVTVIFAVIIGNISLGSSQYETLMLRSIRIAFILYLIICVVAVFFSYFRGKNMQSRE
ncbi:MAG: MFS transporter [Candidatus Heimdallarchaeaceae archaeon]